MIIPHSRALSRTRGFTLVEIMIVVLIIGILMAIAVPNFVRARDSSRTKTCIANLKKIEGAKEQWTMDTQKTEGEPTTMGVIAGAGKYIKSVPTCPSGGTYATNNIGVNATCTKTGHQL